MEMVKITMLALMAAAGLMASDFSIEIASPAAAISPTDQKAVKLKTAAFSVRAKDCADVHFSGTVLWESASKITTEQLVFTQGSTAGAYAVGRSTTNAFGAWIAVITAECEGKTIGALVPVSATNVYNRDAAKFVSHAPTPAEMQATLRSMQESAR